MALTKKIKKEKAGSKFEPILGMAYDVQLLGVAELGTQTVKDFQGEDKDSTKTEELIAMVVHIRGYNEEIEDEDGEEVVNYVPLFSPYGDGTEPLVQTFRKPLNTGSKAFVGGMLDACGKKIRDEDGSVDVVAAIGKFFVMTQVEENIGGKDLKIWKSSRMDLQRKKGLVEDETLPKFIFDLMADETTPGDGFCEDFDAEFAPSSGMVITSALIASVEFDKHIEGSGSALEETIEGFLEEYGTFDNKVDQSKKKPSTRKPAAKKAAPKKAVEEVAEEVEEEDDDAALLAELKAAKAAKAKKAKAAKAKAAPAEDADEGDDDEPF